MAADRSAKQIFDFLMSLDARNLILQEGIIVLSYKPLQEVWRAR
jgi:hypothetical protein